MTSALAQPADEDRVPINIPGLVYRADSLRHVHDFRIRGLVAAVDELADELVWLRRQYIDLVHVQMAERVRELIATGEIENYREDTA